MKKWFQTMMVVMSLCFFCSLTVSANEDYAYKLKELGVFQGSDKGFELERQPTRIEGLVIMLRLLGEEEKAKQFVIEKELFEDVPEWAKPYVYYAYAKGITKGVSETSFAPEVTLQSYAFLTYTLRAMGYKDGVDDTADFIWDQPELFAMSKNLVNESQLSNWSVQPFYRKDAVRVAYTALKTPTDSGKLLAQVLIEKGSLSKEKVVSAGIDLPESNQQESGQKSNVSEQSGNSEAKPEISEKPVLPTIPSEKPEEIKPEFPDEKSYSLIGPASATKGQVFTWAKSKGMSQEGLDLIDIYFEICDKKGLNPVIQYAQMCHETGFLYKVQSLAGLNTSFHNPCGLKVTEGGDGFVADSHKRFKDWYEGIEAHTDHTALYAGVSGYPKTETPDPRHFKFLKGTATMLSDLSGKWAPSWYYHRKIYQMLQEIEAMP
ncbi:hypothetical protein EII17_06520 [Clostridiales bacterium COT073_COT-073]|nr:hypothetical protein EII17_06520 [Clostridiales bacterium COT073_COT-073]